MQTITRTETAKTGPYQGGYVYRIGNRISVQYHNGVSARSAANQRQHRVRDDGLLEPAI